MRSLHNCQKMSRPFGTEILLLYVKKHCKQKPQSLGTTTSFTILVLFLRLCKKHLPKIEAQFLARPFSCHILGQFLGMPHQTGLKCDLKNFSAYKQVKPRFTTTSRIIISIRNTNKNLINSEISEISEKKSESCKIIRICQNV